MLRMWFTATSMRCLGSRVDSPSASGAYPVHFVTFPVIQGRCAKMIT